MASCNLLPVVCYSDAEEENGDQYRNSDQICLPGFAFFRNFVDHPKIVKEHVELIKDLGEFFAYLWGMIGFNMLMSSIKERKEVTLSQKTIAVKGLYMLCNLYWWKLLAMGILKTRKRKRRLSPRHARDLHVDAKVFMFNLID